MGGTSILAVRIEVGNPDGLRFESFVALVNTGSTCSAIPASQLDRLSVKPYKRETFVLADGSEAQFDVGRAIVRVQRTEALTQVVFVEEDFEPRLGRLTLAQLMLEPDEEHKLLVPVPGRLSSPRRVSRQ